MKINIAQFLNGNEKVIPFDYNLDFSDVDISFQHPFTEPVKVNGQLINRAGYAYLQAKLTGDGHFTCDRCGECYDSPVDLDIDTALAYDLEDHDSESIFELDSEIADLDEIFYELLILSFGSKFLCREDCKGICPVCGVNLNITQCDCAKSEVNPRLAALDTLL